MVKKVSIQEQRNTFTHLSFNRPTMPARKVPPGELTVRRMTRAERAEAEMKRQNKVNAKRALWERPYEPQLVIKQVKESTLKPGDVFRLAPLGDDFVVIRRRKGEIVADTPVGKWITPSDKPFKVYHPDAPAFEGWSVIPKGTVVYRRDRINAVLEHMATGFRYRLFDVL